MPPLRDELLDVPSIGKSLATDLHDLGIHSIRQLARRDPERMYRQLMTIRQSYQDPCVLYSFRCAVYYARERRPEPELLKWWNWKSRKLGARGPVLLTLLLAVVATGCFANRASSAPSPRLSLTSAVDSMVADPKFRSAELGILIVDPERGDTLYSHNAGKLFMPASNQKLLTGAVALQALGADFRFSTTFATRASVSNGTLDGDLLVMGTGDPSVSDHMRGDAMSVFTSVADSLATRGIHRIGGRLVSALDAFPDATLGFGWAWDDLDYSYAAGIDELYLNEGFARVVARGGERPGDPVQVTTLPARTYPSVRVMAKTTGVVRSTLSLMQDSSDAGRVVLTGAIAPGATDTLEISFRDQAAAYLTALREGLTARGIVVDGGIQGRLDSSSVGPADSRGVPAGGSTPLFSMVSPPLSEIMRAFEKPSQNQIGEILFKTIGRSRTGSGTADSARAAMRAQLLAWGALPDGFVIRDGSGLSRHNVVTPETIAKVLDTMQRSPNFSVFYDALPVAGIDGTVSNRMRGTPAQGNVHAKTGSLDMVRSLSGYVTTADGHRLIAVILANNWTVPVREVERLQDSIMVKLAGMRLAGGH
ncbi:MAG: D-alanyl-D-alanine carboxypeptidase/D-alanyl-D-alanine-endopeptidase [Gemmatimonadaceae bacterium]